MIRAILAMVWAVLFLIVSMPVHLIYLLIGRFSTARRDRFMQAWVKAGFRVVLFLCGVRVTVKGKENLKMVKVVKVRKTVMVLQQKLAETLEALVLVLA